MKKRLLCLVLTLCTLLALLPATAHAAYRYDEDRYAYIITSGADLHALLNAVDFKEHTYIFYEPEIPGQTLLLESSITLPEEVVLELSGTIGGEPAALQLAPGVTLTNYAEVTAHSLVVPSGAAFLNHRFLSLTEDLRTEGAVHNYNWIESVSGTILVDDNGLFINENDGTLELPAYLTDNNGTLPNQIDIAGDGSFQTKTGSTIRWHYTPTDLEMVPAFLSDAALRRAEHPKWNQETHFLFQDLTITEDLILPEVWLNIQGTLTIEKDATLTTSAVVFLEGSGIICGTWNSMETIVLAHGSTGRSTLTLDEGGVYYGNAIQVSEPWIDGWTNPPWDLLPGFSKGMFDTIQDADPDYYLLLGDTAGHTHTWNSGSVITAPGDHTSGIRAYSCTVNGCHVQKLETIPKLLPDGQGTAGDLTWELRDGILTISGSGPIPDYTPADPPPWQDYWEEIRQITLQKGVTVIGSYAFSQLPLLSYVSMPDSLKTVGSHAFAGCTSLKELSFQPATTQVDFATAFLDCSSLTAIRFDRSNTAYWSSNGVVYTADKRTFLRLPPAYSGSFVVAAGTTTVATAAFAQCNKLTALTLPETISTVEPLAFQTGEQDLAYPAALKTILFEGNAPAMEDAFRRHTVKAPFIVYYYQDAAGWENVLTMDFAQFITFTARSRRIDLASYLEKSAKTSVTLKGAKYFTNNKKDNAAKKAVKTVDPDAFVYSLTEVSLQNADSKTAEFVRGQIKDLLYTAAYRPMQFGGTKTRWEKWPIQNDSYGKKVYSVKDPNLDGTIGWKSYCAGCLSYGRFASNYVYGADGIRNTYTLNSSDLAATNEMIAKFRALADPGETLYYSTKKETAATHSHSNKTCKRYHHALVFLGESADGKGFYFASYNGGLSWGAELHSAYVGYFPYTSFYNIAYKLQIHNTNQGSYYKGNARVARASNKNAPCGYIKSKYTAMELKVSCPVEVVISLGDQILDSRTLAHGGSRSVDFGIMTATGDPGGDRTITVTFNGPASDYLNLVGSEEQTDYAVKILPTGTGQMTVETTFTYADLSHDDSEPEAMTDIRTFQNVPLDADITSAILSGLSEQSDTVLTLLQAEKPIAAWIAGENETTTAAETELDYTSVPLDDSPALSRSTEEEEVLVTSIVKSVLYLAAYDSSGKLTGLTVQPIPANTVQAPYSCRDDQAAFLVEADTFLPLCATLPALS